MNVARTLGPLGASLILAACAASAPQGPSILTFPGNDKSAAAFQQDQAICQRHAISHTGYGLRSEPAAQPSDSAATATAGGAPAGTSSGPATGNTSAPATPEMPDELSYAQCMAARGDTVQVLPAPMYDEQYVYAYPGSIGYGSAYPYPYPLYGAGFVGGFGFFAYKGGYHHGYYNGAYHHGAYHSGGYGAYHGAGHHGGWGGHGGNGGGGHH